MCRWTGRLDQQQIQRLIMSPGSPLSFPLHPLDGFAVACFRGNGRIGRAGGLRGARCRGLAKANAGLITVGELDTGRFARSADRQLIGGG